MQKRDQDSLREKILSDRLVRQEVTRRSHLWFFSVFLPNYIQYDFGAFHQEMFKLTENTKNKLIVIMAFRGSGKSTIMNLSYALWAILGVQKKKFILIVSKTQSQAKNHFLNIRDELEHNDLLKKDLGPFDADETRWGQSSLVLPKMNAKITAISREQSPRGIRFGPNRPDLIICDDLEDSSSVQSKAGRDDTYEWFMSEVMPVGDSKTKVIVLGNLLHEDSLLMRLRTDILLKKSRGIFRVYPLLDDNNRILWPGKYPTKEEINTLETNILDKQTWEREYLLKYVPENQLTELSKEAARLRKKNEAVQETETEYPVHRLGRFKISAPTMTFNIFNVVKDKNH